MFTAFYALIKSAVRCKPGSRRPKYLVTRGGNRHHGRDDGMIGRWIRGFSHRHMAFGPVTVKPDGEIHLQRIDHFIKRHKEWPQCPATVKTKQGSHFLRTHFMADVLSLDNRCCNAAPRAMRCLQRASAMARRIAQPWRITCNSRGRLLRINARMPSPACLLASASTIFPRRFFGASGATQFGRNPWVHRQCVDVPPSQTRPAYPRGLQQRCMTCLSRRFFPIRLQPPVNQGDLRIDCRVTQATALRDQLHQLVGALDVDRAVLQGARRRCRTN